MREEDEKASSSDVRFLGMMHGRWEVPDGAMEGLSVPYTHDVIISAMSIIVPAYKILEVIYQPDLIDLRD